MKRFGVRVLAIESIIVKIPVTWPDGNVTEAPKEQKFARCSASGKRLHMVPLMPEDDIPAVGSRLKLLVPGPADGQGARPILVDR